MFILIELTKTDKENTKFFLNSNNIIEILAGGKNINKQEGFTSLIIMSNEKKIIVSENKEEVVEKIKRWEKSIRK